MKIATCAGLLALPETARAASGGVPMVKVAATVGSSAIAAPRAGHREGRATKSRPDEEETGSAAASFQRARRAIRSGDYELAHALIRRMSKTRNSAERNVWGIIEAELGMAQEKYAAAGLAAMRVVILHPRSRQVGVAYYWAARAYEGLGRPRMAASLFESCLAHETTVRPIREEAEQRLAAFKAKAR